MTERKNADADKIEQHTQVEVAQTDVVEASTRPIVCGLIMPIATNEVGTAEHWSQVRTIIEDALKNTDLKVQMVSESDEVNVIHHNIVTNIYSNDIVICDVSSRNPNVMFELGMRLTFDKPVVIIKDRETPFSFDVGNIQHLEYPRSLNYVEIQKFQDDLKTKTLATLAVSKGNNYSPFLSHYKIKHLAKIDTEVIGREDFIISSLSEMKNEIKRLSSKSSIPTATVNSKSNFDYVLNDHVKISVSESLISILGDSLYQELIDKYGDNIVSEDVAALCDEAISLQHPYMNNNSRALIKKYVVGKVIKQFS
ncbi:hypothetical protein SJR91_00035 [Aeromonas caviae]|uniref:hypothetical protein n=1 Tax=Aeromonas caviae TaxID=648 RepID=UPI0029D8EB83|nr:hypothetical protein [Aeromonas caviae]MDX7845991.1 hypothetical protein [Aeromonas caviae]